jgi:hypothetical protein
MAKKKVNTESQGNAALNMMAQMMASMQGGNAPDSIPAPNVPVETPPVPAAAIGLQSQVVDRLKAEIADLEAELKGIGKPTKRHAKELRDELKAELENRKKVLKQMSGAGSAGGSKPGEGGKAQSKRGKSGKASDTPVHFNREDRGECCSLNEVWRSAAPSRACEQAGGCARPPGRRACRSYVKAIISRRKANAILIYAF